MSDNKEIVIASATHWYPQLRVVRATKDAETFTRYEIKVDRDTDWISVGGETYQAALETAKLSAAQDVVGLLERIADPRRS